VTKRRLLVDQSLRRIKESDARLNEHFRLRGERRVDEESGRLRAQTVVLSPAFSLARPLAWRNPGRKVQDPRKRRSPLVRPQLGRTSQAAPAPDCRSRDPVHEEAESSLGRGHRFRRSPGDARCTLPRSKSLTCAEADGSSPRRPRSAISRRECGRARGGPTSVPDAGLVHEYSSP
jgi:hypothetical protein